MYNLTDYKTIKQLLGQQDFHFSKALGQNFLVNPDICPAMAEQAGITQESGVLEIGAGIGVLTVELAKRAKKVVTLEIDTRLLPILGRTLADCPNTEVLNRDILKTDLPLLVQEQFGELPLYVCANLPYYITSPVIMALLESRVPFRAITVMVQKEAAERICAPVGSRSAGALTAAVSYYAEADYLFDVDRDSFMPPPKVDSAVIRLTVRKTPPVQVADEKYFFRVIQSAFAQRRKTAANSLSAGLGKDKQTVLSALEKIGAAPTDRAETFSLEQFALLAQLLGE